MEVVFSCLELLLVENDLTSMISADNGFAQWIWCVLGYAKSVDHLEHTVTMLFLIPSPSFIEFLFLVPSPKIILGRRRLP